MGSLFQSIIRYKKSILFIFILITIFFSFQLKKIRFDPSLDRLSPGASPSQLILDRTLDIFGNDQIASIYIKDSEVFKLSKLKKIQTLVRKLQEIPEIESIQSIFTTAHIKNRSDVLYTSPIFEDLPKNQDEIKPLLQEINDNSLLSGRLVNVEHNEIMITIQYKKENTSAQRVFKKIELLLDPLSPHFSELFQTGIPALMNFVQENIIKTLSTLLPLGILAITGLIYFATKSLNAAFLPLIIATISLIWTGAFMVFFNIPIQLLNCCIPAISFILGSTEITHLLSKYRSIRLLGHSNEQSIIIVGDQLGMAIILTVITTVLGFLSICFNEISMLREFGIVAGLSLVFNFIAMAIYLPIHLSLFQEESERIDKKNDRVFFIELKLFQRIFEYLLANQLFIIIVLLLCLISFASMKRITVENVGWSQIKESTSLKSDLKKVSKSFPGAQMMRLVLEPTDGSFENIEHLEKLHQLQKKINEVDGVDSTLSLADQIVLIHRELNNQAMSFRKLPSDDETLAQYMLSLDRDQIGPFLSANYKIASIQIRHSGYTSKGLDRIVDQINKLNTDNIDTVKYRYYLTSTEQVVADARNSMVTAQLASLTFIIVMIIIAMTILFRDIKIALIAVPSNLIPVIIFFGILGLFQIPLNNGTAMVAAITVGIAVDDTIHFFVQYSKILEKYANPHHAALETIKVTSRPIVTTSISLALGFSILYFSNFTPLSDFGVFSAIVILLAMLCDLVVTPTIITAFKLVNIMPFQFFQVAQLPYQELINKQVFKGLSLYDFKKLISLIGIQYGYGRLDFNSSKKEPPQGIIILLDGTVRVLKQSQRQNEKLREIELDQLTPGSTIDLKKVQDSHLEASDSVKYITIDSNILNKIAKFYPSLYSRFCDNINKII